MSAYQAIIIQNIGDQESPYAFAGTDTNGYTVEDPFDHGMSHKAMARAITIYRKRSTESEFSQILRDSDINLEMTITDCRVIYRCDKYDKGSTWSGGLTALALNAVERAVANKKTAGKVMLGHIRYEWIREIAYIAKEKNGFLDSDIYAIRIIYMDTEKTRYMVETTFNKGMDTAFIANEILHSASKYRLAMKDDKEEKELEFFGRYSSENIKKSDDVKNFSTVLFPNHYFAPRGKENRPEW